MVRRAESPYEAIFAATSDGLVVTDLESGRVLEANPAFCRMHGYTREELLGADRRVYIHPDFHPLLRRYVDTLKAGGEFCTRSVNVRKDGTTFHVEVLGRVFTFEGAPAILGVVRDVTEHVEFSRLLEEQVAERTRAIEALYRADDALYRSLKLEDILQALVDVAVDILRADKTSMMVWDARAERLVLGAARGFGPDSLVLMRAGQATGITAEVARSGEAITVEDARGDPRVLHPITDREGIRSLLHVPIRVGDEVFGVFGVNYCQPHTFTGDEERLLNGLAQRAALAIGNARLHQQAVQGAALAERQKLARELHDSVSQALYGIALGAQTALGIVEGDREPRAAAEPLRYVLNLAEAGLAEMRALIFELRPESLEQEGLVAALEKQAAAARARHRLTVTTSLGGEPDLPLAAKEALYRVAQEAIQNVVKHARASSVRLALAKDEAGVCLEVADDGRGFDPRGTFPGHLGLRSMRERLQGVGGTVAVESSPGQGSRVVARVPRTTPD